MFSPVDGRMPFGAATARAVCQAPVPLSASTEQSGAPPERARSDATADEVEVRFEARDGVELVGDYVAAANPRGAVLLAPGTGIPTRFYHPFARWLAGEGFTSLVLDYRGMGRSLFGRLRDCEARKQDWGEKDMPGALDELTRRAPDVPLSLVGHSAGGQLVGLMDNCARLDRIVQIAGSSGYFGGLGIRYRVLATLLMQVYGPLSIKAVGYGALEPIGWGENLPAGVLRQWTAWCSRPGYVSNDFGRTIESHLYDDIRCPILNFSGIDDAIATDANVDDLLRLFPSATVTKERIDPADHGLDSIEHVGFFRPKSSVLWPRVPRFLAGDGGHDHG